MDRKVVSLLKIVLRAGTAQEALTARLQACQLCAKHALDYDALMAQAAQELATEDPERKARETAQPAQEKQDVRHGRTWDDTPADVWTARTKYDPHNPESRALLARAVKSVLEGVGFGYASTHKSTKEEVWEKVVAADAVSQTVVKVYTSIVDGAVRGIGTDQIRICAVLRGDRWERGIVSSKTRNGRKGHTVKRVGRFGAWQEGRDHRHRNNPGILGRLYRELLNVRDAALEIAGQAPAQETRESDLDFLKRVVREFGADLKQAPHPSKFRARQGETMYDYVGWLLSDERNRTDRSGRDRVGYTREAVETLLHG